MTHITHALLLKWAKAHGVSASEIDDLPKLGLLVSYQNIPIAVCFLRFVEGRKGMIDAFMCDPTSEPFIRTKCLDQLIYDLIELARFNEMTGIFGLTLNPRVIKRAAALGFEVQKHKLVSLNLTKEKISWAS